MGRSKFFRYVVCLQEQRRLFAEWLAGRAWLPRPLGRAIGRWTLLLRPWRDSAATENDFQVQLPDACGRICQHASSHVQSKVLQTDPSQLHGAVPPL